jgi:hypothetical protein
LAREGKGRRMENSEKGLGIREKGKRKRGWD